MFYSIYIYKKGYHSDVVLCGHYFPISLLYQTILQQAATDSEKDKHSELLE